MHISSVMRAHVVTVTCDATPAAVADVFAVYQQAVVPVVDAADRLVGSIRPGTLLRRLASLKAGRLLDTKAAELADTGVPTACCDDDALAAAARMLDGQHEAIVVVDDGKVVGLVGVPEACRILIESMTEANQAVG